MAEWQVARLIPTWGINSDVEAEMRAASATLAVMSIVRDLSIALLGPLGASSARKAQVESFVEVSFKLPDGSVIRPDGLIRVSFGKSVFTALVEVKTGKNPLIADQVNAYWDAARQYDFDAVITISNEIAPSGAHPTEGLKVRSNSKVQVHHYSWSKILTTAIMFKDHRGVDDIEQAWILGELIRYLESGASGAVPFTDMGPNWVPVRDGAKESTLVRSSEEVSDIAQRWDQLLQAVCLRLGSEIGADVQKVVPKGQHDAKARLAYLIESLCVGGSLDGSLKVPNAVGVVGIEADLRARWLTISVDVSAPSDRGNKARTSWLFRQLGENQPTNLTVEAWPRNARTPLSASWHDASDNRELLEDPDGREILRYRLLLRSEMGAARRSGGKAVGFVDSVNNLLDLFYGKVVQAITAWTPPAPRLRPKEAGHSDAPAEVVDSRPDAEDAMDMASEVASGAARDRSGDGRPVEVADVEADTVPGEGEVDGADNDLAEPLDSVQDGQPRVI